MSSNENKIRKRCAQNEKFKKSETNRDGPCIYCMYKLLLSNKNTLISNLHRLKKRNQNKKKKLKAQIRKNKKEKLVILLFRN